ncbi:MAG: TfoX/Sxy family protein [Gemmatimonadales bacterium]|nr:TfoX/Sxy family protein [Gemmatimonadales bacterium]
MPVSEAFRDYVLEQLAGLGAVTVRRMFGGAGLYHGGLFFAVLDDDQLFFKVNDDTRPAYVAAGAGPFAPMPNEAPMRGYYEVPADVLDDRDRLVEWARGAVKVARGAAAPKKRAGRKVARKAGASDGLTPARILQMFPPRIRSLAAKVRDHVKRALPTVREVPYPGWKAIGYRDPDAGLVCTIFPYKECVRLYLEHGAKLADPDRIIEGAGKTRQVRYVTMRLPGDVKARALTRALRAALAFGAMR